MNAATNTPNGASAMTTLKLRKNMNWTTLDDNGYTELLAIESSFGTQEVLRHDGSRFVGARVDETFDPSACYRVRTHDGLNHLSDYFRR
jgi:hypothetical protein